MNLARTGLRVPILSDLGDAALDIISSVFDRVPGSEWIEEAASEGATWLGDMAQTDVGRTILTAISMTYLYEPLASMQIPGAVGQVVVGPIVASATWALPGMVAGESFTEAYVTELTWRIQGLVEYFAGRYVAKIGQEASRELGVRVGDLFGAQLEAIGKDPLFQQYMHEFKARVGDAVGAELKQRLKDAKLDPEALSRRLKEFSQRFDVAPDVFAAAINANFKGFVYDIDADFDVYGQPVVRGAGGRVLSPRTPVSERVLVEQGIPIRGKRASDQIAVVTSTATPKALKKPKTAIFGELLTVSLLTAPLWIPVLVLPRLKKRKRIKG